MVFAAVQAKQEVKGGGEWLWMMSHSPLRISLFKAGMKGVLKATKGVWTRRTRISTRRISSG